jgi:hypothetical protein
LEIVELTKLDRAKFGDGRLAATPIAANPISSIAHVEGRQLKKAIPNRLAFRQISLQSRAVLKLSNESSKVSGSNRRLSA